MADKHPLRAFRESKGWSQEQLAHELGVTGMTVHRWETGKRVPRRGQWAKLKTMTKIEPEDFMRAAEAA